MLLVFRKHFTVLGLEGVEPSADRLKAGCSTTELQTLLFLSYIYNTLLPLTSTKKNFFTLLNLSELWILVNVSSGGLSFALHVIFFNLRLISLVQCFTSLCLHRASLLREFAPQTSTCLPYLATRGKLVLASCIVHHRRWCKQVLVCGANSRISEASRWCTRQIRKPAPACLATLTSRSLPRLPYLA